MIDFLKSNYEWLFGGIGATFVAFIATRVFKDKETANPWPTQTSVSIINNVGSDGKQISATKAAEDRLKERVRILFIDDMHTDYKMVSILKKAGWGNTRSVKDILDLDDQKVIDSDIIFVDINGVGTTMFEDQGLGLASALKSKYPQKKIVLYSAESAGDRFHRALREVDDCLAKNAEPYQFINLVESLSKELYQ